MVDLKVLEKRNSTQARLKEICTATVPPNYHELTEEQQKQNDRDMALRKQIEDRIQFRLWESIQFNLKNYQLFSAVDLAWDSTPINKAVYPLMLYAQGKLKLGDCADSLESAGFGKYVTKDASGKVLNVDIPKFYETQVNLIRSILTRRLAAQSNKYANLWPYYFYESRSTSLTGKLRADIMSQRMDIVSDQYGYRHHEVQVMRDMLLYCNSVDFIRCAWEKEYQEFFKEQAPGLETAERDIERRCVKEGIPWVNPHPSRVFWDNSYPLTSINEDTGCEWVGYWDVLRYRDIALNTTYWNRDVVSYSTNMQGLFTQFAPYWNQYYTNTITAPQPINDVAGDNDRKNNVGLYASEQGDVSVIVSYFFWKIVPKDWGIGDYPYPVWTRFIIASDRTIQFAEFLPSTPGAVASYNANDNRQINISFAHELMGYQDQLTNLLTYLLLCLQADNIKVLIVDKDVADPIQIKAFREQLKGQSAFTGTTVLEISRSKLEGLGINSPDQIVKLVETRGSQLDVIFRAIGQLLQMVERMAALSPQEQGQPAPREISATETNLIAGTTESVYGFISDAIDEYRAAKKRILYESYIALGEQNFRFPVINRYPKNVITAAGFKAEDGEQEQAMASNGQSIPMTPARDRYTILGTKEKLVHDYIFTSRDGAERPVNTQSANVLVQLLQSVISLPPILASMKKDQLFSIVNEIFRQAGAGHDLKLEVEPGEENSPLGPNPTEETIKQIGQMIEGLTQSGEKSNAEIEQLKNAVAPLLQALSARGLQTLPAAA